MSSSSLALPRGLIPGTCFAVLLAVPLFFAISLDSSTSAFASRFRFGGANSIHQRPITTAEFFDRQVAVQVFVGFRSTSSSASGTRTSSLFGSVDHRDTARPKPQRIFQFRIENRSSTELAVDVLEAKSEFGDLSAGLQTIRLAPGQMTQTGVALKEGSLPTKPSPVQVTLRLGNRQEMRQLILAPTATL